MWMSFVSMGTKRELLTLIQYGSTQIDNRIILTRKDITSFDPRISTFYFVIVLEVYENGVLVTSGETNFLFKSLGAKHAEPEGDFKEDNEEQTTESNGNETEAPKEDYWLQVANRLLSALHENSISLPSPVRETANGIEDEL